MRLSFSNSIMAIAAATALSAISAPANAQSGEIKYFTPDNIKSALADQNINFETRVTSGTTFLIGEKDGYRFTLALTACGSNNQCMGVQIQSSWAKSDTVSRDAMLERIRKFNNKYDFVKANMYDSGGYYIARYAISDYGINPKTFHANFTNFLYLLSKFDTQVVKGTTEN